MSLCHLLAVWLRPRWPFGSTLLIGALFGNIALSAPSSEPSLAQLGVQQWRQAEGLSSNWVRDLVETPDGFIWIASVKGLSRFDGKVFSHFNSSNLPGLPRAPVTDLALSPDGTLLIGLEYGGIRRLEGDRLDPVEPVILSGMDATVMDMRWVGDTLWVASARGLWRVLEDREERVESGAPLAEAVVVALQVHRGSLWARTDSAGLWHLVDGRWQSSPDAPGCFAGGFVIDVAGTQYSSCRNGVWMRADETSEWQRIHPAASVGKLFVDAQQRLLIGGPDGLLRWSKGAMEQRPLGDGLNDWRVRAFLQDHRGDVWIGTFAGGVSRLREGAVRSLGRPEGLHINSATAVLSDGEQIWAGAFRGGLFRTDHVGERLQHWSTAQGLPGQTPWALAFDVEQPNAIWVGTESGLAWLHEGRLHPAGPKGQRWAGHISVLYADPIKAGTLWISDRVNPVIELSADGITRHDANVGLPLRATRFIARDRGGHLLAGGAEGLFQQRGDRWHRIDLGEPRRDYVSAFAEATDGTLWVASGALGLVRLKEGRRAVFGYDSGLSFWPIHTLALEGDDFLWMSGDGGLASVRLDDLDGWEQGELPTLPIEHFDRRDGLLDDETNGWGVPSITRLNTGELVYPSLRGLALIDTSKIRSPTVQPDSLYLLEAWAGTRALPLDANGFELDTDERSLRVRYSAVETLRPEAIQFRHRLVGLEQAWSQIEPGNEARYSRIPPGEYRFEFQARAPSGDWVTAAQSYRVHVVAGWWERLDVRIAVGLLILSIAAAVTAWRAHIRHQHARSLLRARTFLRDVIDTSPHPIFVRAKDGSVALSNQAATAVIERQSELAGSDGPETIPVWSNDFQRLATLDRVVISESRELVIDEFELQEGEQSARWYKVIKRPGFSSDGGEVEHVITTAVDISGYKHLELKLREEAAKLRRSREEARQLAAQVLNAQEDERRRLAREMHDDVTQRLAGLAMLAWSTLQALERGGDQKSSAQMQELALALEGVANDVQVLSRELHPPALETLGLVDALHSECRTFAQRTGFEVEFDCVEPISEPNAAAGLAIYRIVQEALRNARTHSSSANAIVSVRSTNAMLQVEVRDFGHGFDPAAKRTHGGMGLASMQERARLAGATFTLESSAGEGTCCRVELPLG